MKLKQKYFERDAGKLEVVDTGIGHYGDVMQISAPETYKTFVNRVNKFIKNRTDIISIQYDNDFWCCVVVYEDKKGK